MKNRPPKADPAKVIPLDLHKRIILDPTYPTDSAAQFMERYHRHRTGTDTLRHHRGAFYRWTEAHYSEVSAADLRATVYRFLDEAAALRIPRGKNEAELTPFKPTARHVSDLLDALRARAHVASDTDMPAWLDGRDGPHELIPMANGLLEPKTNKLHTHSPSYFGSYSLPFDYDPAAPIPAAWLAFLATLWPDDQESIDTLQELFGLLLTADTRHQKLFMLVGPPRSGKGTIARIIQNLLGRTNVAGPTLSGMAMNFGLQELIGKPAAIISDARLSGRSDAAIIAERLLSISGEDIQTIDRKHRDPWTGTLSTRIIILTNELPRIADASGALATRFIILMLEKSFLGQEDHGLTGRLLNELPGILNWALNGRKRLAERGRFVMPRSSQEAVDRLMTLGSPIRAFLADKCVIGHAATIKCGELYEHWRAWCQEQGRDKPGNLQAFGNALHSAVPGLKTSRPRVNGVPGPREYVGLRLRLNSDP